MPSVECKNLVKVFGGTRAVRALDGLNLDVHEGEVFGLLGPNGSGKTTFVKCCLNIIFPSSGNLSVLGRKPGHPKTAIQTGYLPESPNFYDYMSGEAFLHYHTELARIPITKRRSRIIEVLDAVKLDRSAAKRRLRSYSKGMLQRVGLAQALLGHPKILFLDEPQTGLDPIGRRQIKDIMRDAASGGSTIIFSSHVLGDVEDVADRVAILDKGVVRRVATTDELTGETNRVTIRLMQYDGMDQKIKTIAENHGAIEIEFIDGMLKFVLADDKSTPKIVHDLVTGGFEIYEVGHDKLTLEESFIREVETP